MPDLTRDEAERLLHEYDRRMERGHSAQSLTSARHHFEQAEEMRAAVLDAMTRATPDGWKLVPETPTDAMLLAMLNAPERGERADNELELAWYTYGPAYTAALAAAPEAPKEGIT